MNLNRQAGMTLIELMIGIVVFAILLALGAPTFSRWTQNSQIRNSAEAIHNGLMLARAEAVRRNTTVRFQLVTTTTSACALSATGGNWVVSLDDPAGACDAAPSDNVAPRIVQVRSAAEGSRNAAVNAGGVSLITFNGTGQASAAAAINVTNPTGGACAAPGPMRCMRVTVATGGQIRMCDPARAADDPQGC
ncbi:MAG TPA: GspH/FimT family pseudopilin [Candidatus Competibacteraceae bacterium]|nr:GspH/FimT family pseudopilin [Candidatus Competibacteraceae bacterium]